SLFLLVPNRHELLRRYREAAALWRLRRHLWLVLFDAFENIFVDLYLTFSLHTGYSRRDVILINLILAFPQCGFRQLIALSRKLCEVGFSAFCNPHDHPRISYLDRSLG